MSEKCSNSDDLNLEDNISNEDLESAEKSAEKDNFTEVPNGMLKFFPIYPYFGVPQVTHSTIVYLNIRVKGRRRKFPVSSYYHIYG